MHKLSTLWVAIWLLLGLAGCDSSVERGPDADEVAIEFFDRLYNQRNLESAAELASEEYRPLLSRYGTVNAVSRYLYNMNFDQVTIEADRQGIQLYREQSDTARVQVSFSGQRNNQRVETLRDVVLVRQNNRWRVSRVMEVF
ncbi:hypothetical protein [Aliidiomarina maris]|uniref:DUF3828 domain-containing protein n=1 Tax=Aliidiomarina maris TaxID=531312 RepID=A0A327X3B3_9GAMM|nr:hypothetical protein [Aliidiomarina maris]RAK01437.1 hypothetical protein B0I24_10160 [Aliidiomarina maris]RUO28277.1 hypothetical protein CWE07_00275 [Aliidiomarina maris]